MPRAGFANPAVRSRMLRNCLPPLALPASDHCQSTPSQQLQIPSLSSCTSTGRFVRIAATAVAAQTGAKSAACRFHGFGPGRPYSQIAETLHNNMSLGFCPKGPDFRYGTSILPQPSTPLSSNPAQHLARPGSSQLMRRSCQGRGLAPVGPAKPLVLHGDLASAFN